MTTNNHPSSLAFTFGILGNVISFLVYLAPLPTFYRIFKKKTTEGFQSLPYLVALFSCMLWLYYAFLKTDAVLLITINSVGCVIEIIYITIFIIYATNDARKLTVKLFAGMNMGLFGVILFVTHFALNGILRVQVLGWICVSISVTVFAAPLSIVAQVIRTKSVQFMPFNLSFFLTLSAVMWFAYGLFLRDICIALPNVLGFALGVLQMLLYAIYRNGGGDVVVKTQEKEKEKEKEKEEEEKVEKANSKGCRVAPKAKKWSCVDSCCWFIGVICSLWWFLLFLYNAMPASFPQYVAEAITGPYPDPPGVKLRKEGLTANHPVVFVPGIVTGGLELWEGRQCADGLFRQRLWGGTFGELYKRPLCWVEHMSLDNETGLDRPGIRVRPVSGLVAADYFAPGYFVWAVLIANLARVGYEEKNMYMAAYDWRISFQNTEVRDRTLSRIKNNIELMVATNGGKKVVVIPHSMGVLYFLHFMKWVEAPPPMGGGGGSDWCAKHIKAVMNIGGPFLGVPKSVAGLFSIEARDIAVARAFAPGVLDKDVFGLQTLEHLMRMTRTWDSTMSMIPKGGDTIWGGLDWSPEGYYNCSAKKHKTNDSIKPCQNDKKSQSMKHVNYGRLISFGKDAAELHSSKLDMLDFRGSLKGRRSHMNTSTCDIWTEYHEMGVEGIRAVSDYKAYTADAVLDLLRFVAPKMMKRGDAHFSHGIADNLDDPKYKHYKYWSNPLETRLPHAPDMEIYSMYGVGIPTERAYVYKSTSQSECYIPFQIDTSANGGDEDPCLKDGVYSANGDETVPVLSAGFMCAKGWRGKTRFNPSGIQTFIREYEHAPPANLLEGRGTQSGAHVDILGNFALIEDIIRVAAGASGEDLGGDRVHSEIFKWSENINLKL